MDRAGAVLLTQLARRSALGHGRDAPTLQLLRQARGIPMDDVDARVIRELAPEIRGKRGIQLEEQ